MPSIHTLRSDGSARTRLFSLIFVAGLLLVPAATRAQIYVTQYGNNIGQYSLSGDPINVALVPGLSPAPGRIAISDAKLFVTRPIIARRISVFDAVTGSEINDSLISGLNSPYGIAISASDMFVTVSGGVGHYTTAGATVNSSLITGLQTPRAIAVSSEHLWVADRDSGTIGLYTTSGAIINASLVSGLDAPTALALLGRNLFVLSPGDEGTSGTIGVYDSMTGAVINPELISGPSPIRDIAVFDGSLFVAFTRLNQVRQYSTSGQLVNSFVVDTPSSLAVVPEPSTAALLLLFASQTILLRRR